MVYLKVNRIITSCDELDIKVNVRNVLNTFNVVCIGNGVKEDEDNDTAYG